MKKTALVTFALMLVATSPEPRAQQAGAGPSAGNNTGVVSANAGAALVATNHPRLSRDIAQLWFVPNKERAASLNEFATAVKLQLDENYAKALPLLSQPSVQQGPLGHYAMYYAGLAELRLGRPADARRTFRAVQERQPVGYLVEAAALREAECDEALSDPAAALDIYERLSKATTTAPDDVLMRLGRAAKAVGDPTKAAEAFMRVYSEFPLGDLSALASSELEDLPNVQPIAPDTPRYELELGRAERLFGAKRYVDARAAFERLRGMAQGDDRELVQLRLAECDYFLKRARNAREGVRPYLDHTSRQAEALFFYAVSVRALGDHAEYLKTVRRLASDFPEQSWAEEALNNLAAHYLLLHDDEQADAALRELYEKYPTGRYAERAAWRLGWGAYKRGRWADTTRVFERAAADFPRSDYRPPWLYWSGRAHELLKETSLADERYSLVAADYLNSYYGRLAVKRLGGRTPPPRVIVDEQTPPGAEDQAPPIAPRPPNESIVRALLGIELFDQALDELRYAQKVWGDSSAIQATIAWISRQQGQSESGTRQFTLLRGAITTMKRAYPQFMAAGGEEIPRDVLTVIFPIAYWDLIRKHAAQHNLDPYLVAALIAQESTFVPDIRSSANAVGLMQLLPSTARQTARALNLKYSPRLLTNPEANIQMGTAYLADRINQFGELHLVLASYNAGPHRVMQWMAERPDVDREEFIDDIPFTETQNYVKKILSTAEDYRRLYGGEPPRGEPEVEAKPAPASRRKAASAPAEKTPALKGTPAPKKKSRT